MNVKDFTEWYIHNRPVYKRLSEKVESVLIELFEAKGISYHMVTSRVKDIESARKKASDDKYEQPTDLQDYAGIRVITYVEDEVKAVTQVIEELFDIDHQNSSNKSEALGIDKVGYKSVHYIAKLKADRLQLPEYKQYVDKCFEIQIRTILQHAWAEIEHDRNYKFSGKLDTQLTRRFKLLSGVLELADREFNSISNEIDEIADSVVQGKLDTEISSAAVASLLKSRFAGVIEELSLEYYPDVRGTGIAELERFGITCLEKLSDMIPEDTDEYLRISASEVENEEYFYELGILRNVMIIADTDRYFSEAMLPSSRWTSWCHPDEIGLRERSKEYLERHGVDIEHIEQTYGIPYYPPH
ncbi:GTP pyrophosphokinase [Vibrio sp. TRT 2004]|uniref:GTP pyrophosphokinase n=1 Tax=Vibrio sp. TRT 2004 TaxID=3418506 RepID=UPI003CE9451C